MSRPTIYTADLDASICGQIAEGKPLTVICRADEMPSTTTVYRWIAENQEFRDRYARAREDQADTLADEILHIADESLDPQLGRLRVDARKWVAAKLKPKKYGDKVSQEISGSDGGPIKTSLVVEFVGPAPK